MRFKLDENMPVSLVRTLNQAQVISVCHINGLIHQPVYRLRNGCPDIHGRLAL